MLLTDTNILMRCCIGAAMNRVKKLQDRGVVLAITDRNAEELISSLADRYDLDLTEANAIAVDTLSAFGIVLAEEYEALRAEADDRLGPGGKSDWPTLAAAMALEAEIWSDDRDFFGVGVPVWSTPNVQFASSGEG